MLFTSILLLSINAVIQRRDTSIFYARIVITILICYLILCINSFHYEFYASISASNVWSLFFLLSYVNKIFNLILFIEFTLVLSLIYYNLNFFFLFLASGCPFPSLSKVVLIKSVSSLYKYISLALSFAINKLLAYAFSLISTIKSCIYYIWLRCSIFYLNPYAANYMYFFILFILYLKQWSGFFLSYEFLSEYMLQMEGPSGAGGGGTPGWGPAGAPGNAPNGYPFNQMFTKNEDSKPEYLESIKPKAWEPEKIQLKIWENPSTDFPVYEPYTVEQTERLYVKIHSKTNENPGFLAYSFSEQGEANPMKSKYIIATLGKFDVHIDPENIEVFKKDENDLIKTINKPNWIEVRNQNKPAMRIVDQLNRYTWMSRNSYNFRVGRGD